MCMHMHVYDHPSSIGTKYEACRCICVSTGRSKAVVVVLLDFCMPL